MAQYKSKIMLRQKQSADAAAREGRVSVHDLQLGAVSANPSSPSAGDGGDEGPEDDMFDTTRTVVFHATPEVQETGTATWVELPDIRSPSSISYYMGSPSRTFSIAAKFVSRTMKEADTNFKYMNALRSWRMPYTQSAGLEESFGKAEPVVVHLFGYGNVFRGIPVIVRSLNIDLNGECDYIKSTNGSDIPIIWPITINLQEIHTLNDFASFDIDSFRNGTLGWW